MPVLETIVLETGTKIGTWQVSESVDTLCKSLPLSHNEQKEFQLFQNEKRKSEWLAARHVLHHLCGLSVRQPVDKDEYGKPYLMNGAHQISISHSSDYAAAIISGRTCGIDIQKMTNRISGPISRILSAAELQKIPGSDPIRYMTLYWCAKEALYKAYGKGKLDFRKQLKVRPFAQQEELFLSDGEIIFPDRILRFDLVAFERKGFIILAALKKES